MAVFATVHDPERKAEIEAIFGTATLPVRNFIPYGGFHEVILDSFSPQILGKLYQHLAEKNQVPIEQVRASITGGEKFAILASNCTVVADGRDAAIALSAFDDDPRVGDDYDYDYDDREEEYAEYSEHYGEFYGD
jgi:hypothetical protein